MVWAVSGDDVALRQRSIPTRITFAANPTLIAVSCLSPVNTQIFTPACRVQIF
ncbi:hypothetical protein HMI54_009572 [Coelomomyces lativittatus]|nr:hypothetical protein HMI54_009572 [Coelomomyces lativittatus]